MTLDKLFPHLKPALRTATHIKRGQVDIVEYYKNGKVGIRYLYNMRVFRGSANLSEFTDLEPAKAK